MSGEFRKRASALQLQVKHGDLVNPGAIPVDHKGAAECRHGLASLEEHSDQTVSAAMTDLVIERNGKNHGRCKFVVVACTGSVASEFLGCDREFGDPEPVPKLGLDQGPNVRRLVGIGRGLEGRQENGEERCWQVPRRVCASSGERAQGIFGHEIECKVSGGTGTVR